MTFHSEADERLTGRCAQRRKIANNTWLERRGDNIAVRLHQTDVLLFEPDGFVTYDSGGWLTVTTKDRMNTFGPLTIHQNKGEWFVGANWRDADRPYSDGMGFNPETNEYRGLPSPIEVAEQRDRNAEMRKQIRKFVKSITPEMIVQAWEHPEGDCLLCRFDRVDCLELHISDDEMYFHATLAKRAIVAKGYRMPDTIMAMIYHDACRGRVDPILTADLGKFLRKSLLEGVSTR